MGLGPIPFRMPFLHSAAQKHLAEACEIWILRCTVFSTRDRIDYVAAEAAKRGIVWFNATESAIPEARVKMSRYSIWQVI